MTIIRRLRDLTTGRYASKKKAEREPSRVRQEVAVRERRVPPRFPKR